MRRQPLAILAMAAVALHACAAPKQEKAFGCIDVTPRAPESVGWVRVNGLAVLADDAGFGNRNHPDRARWKELQTTATIRCTDGNCAVVDEGIAGKDCLEEACWHRGQAAADYNVGELAISMAKRNKLVPTSGIVEITARFRTVGPIRPPLPCPY